MLVVGVIMMGVMLFGLFSTGGFHHMAMTDRGSSHAIEQTDHGQGQSGDIRHRMMPDRNRDGHDHGGFAADVSDGDKARETPPPGEKVEREGRAQQVQDHGTGSPPTSGSGGGGEASLRFTHRTAA